MDAPSSPALAGPRPRLESHPGGPPGAVVDAEGDWGEITEGLKGVTQRADLEPLLEQGLMTREAAFPTPPPRPKSDRQVRLLADAEAIARALPTLGRASKQAEVLAQIANRQSQTAIPLDELCAAVGCTRGR